MMNKQLTVLSVIAIGAMAAQTALAKQKPETKIPEHAKGPEIIEKLGSKLPEVAHFYGMTADGFREMVDHDHSIHADEVGRLYCICEGLTVEEAPGIDARNTSFTTLGAAENAFNLSSNPGASKTIFLDFDGHVTSGTSWNSRVGGSDIVTPAYDTDGNPSSFSNTELTNIREIWERVAEDYAPWDVNVTTVDPGTNSLQRSSTSDDSYGVRVVIGGSSTDWYGNAGGVAYIGSFNWSSDTPCFVFENQLGNGNIKYTSEAISHEVGHTFFLYHDGNSSTAYYQGHANWAPIMGVGYYKAVTQWSKGDYANANNTEDDIAKITNMVPLRADAVADDMSSTAVLGQTPIVEVVESSNDADVYKFQTDGGAISLTAEAAYQGNLDIRMALYDGFGSVITSANNGSSLNASISTTVSPGTYYVLVEGTAPGDPTTAYNEYGSIGYYRISASYATSANQSPVAMASSSVSKGRTPLVVNFSSAGSTDPDGSIVTYDWDFGDGATSTSANPSHTYMDAGVYTANLVVIDDKGASANDSVVITVTEPQAPVADASATTPTSGTAPLTVTLDGRRSDDADGTITAFNWTISTGASASGSTSSYTFNDPGTYTVTLNVSDNEGLSDSDSVTIVVSEPAPPQPQDELFVENVSVSVSGNSKKGYTAFAEATVVDAKGRTVKGATVYGHFSGMIEEDVFSNSGRKGDASFRSSKFRDNGSVSFEVTNVVMEGYIFVP